jgi:hypothetical protein
MFDRHAYHLAFVVKIEINIFIQFLSFHGHIVGKLQQSGISSFKVLGLHGLVRKLRSRLQRFFFRLGFRTDFHQLHLDLVAFFTDLDLPHSKIPP